MTRPFLAACVLAVSFPVLVSRAEPQGYTFHDLGKVHGMAAGGGRVVGPIQVDPGYHAFVWSLEDGMVFLGTLPGGTESRSVAGGAGDVVFGVSDADDGHQHVFRWSPAEGMVELGALFPGESNLRIPSRGASSSGQIVGSFGDFEYPQAFSWTPEAGGINLDPILRALRPDATLFGSQAYAVSEQGEVVGVYWTRTLPWNGRTFYWKQGEDPLDLGDELINGPAYDPAPYPPTSGPFDVDAGEVVGQISGNASFGRYAAGFSWTRESGLRDLGTLGWPSGDVLPLHVRGGEIVGFAHSVTGSIHAFHGSAEGIRDLHDPGWTDAGWPQSQAVDARDGSVAGHRLFGTGIPQHAMLWSPDGEWFDLHPCGWILSNANPWSTFDGVGAVVINGWDADFNVRTGVYLPGGEPLVPDDVTVALDPGECSAVVTFDVPGCAVAEPPSGSRFPVGTTTVQLTKDGAPSGSFEVTVEGGDFEGFLPPIDGIGGSFAAPVRAFKLGSTIPVKFRALCGADAGGPAPTVTVTKWADATTSAIAIDATPTDAATEGDQARAVADGWHYNLSTRPLSKGVWEIRVTLADGMTRSVFVELK